MKSNTCFACQDMKGTYINMHSPACVCTPVFSPIRRPPTVAPPAIHTRMFAY